MVGFMTLDTDGYIELAFVRSDLSGRGIGQSLYKLIEARVVADGIERLTTEASVSRVISSIRAMMNFNVIIAFKF